MTSTIGIDLRAATILAVALDEHGTILADATAPLSVGGAVEAAAAAGRAAGLDPSTRVGLAAWEPNLSEVQSVAAELRRAGVPTVVTAGAGLAAAAAETAYGAGREAHYVACLLVGQHVSAGAEVSDSGIARRLTWRVEAGDLSRVVEQAGGLDQVTATHVLDGARGGDGVAISVVRDTARYIGMAVANLIALFDPEVVVVGGFVATASDLLLEPVRQETLKRLSPTLCEHARLELPALGEQGVAIGAARLAALSTP